PFVTLTLQRYLFVVWTKSAAGRACSPSLFLTANVFSVIINESQNIPAPGPPWRLDRKSQNPKKPTASEPRPPTTPPPSRSTNWKTTNAPNKPAPEQRTTA